jgi:hypothetical protein
MRNLEKRQADMRARKARRAVKRARPENLAITQAVQILHNALEAKLLQPKPCSHWSKPRRAGLPKAGSRPCALHPDDPGLPSYPARCNACKNAYHRARSAVYGYTPGTRYGVTRAAARKRGLDFTITLAEYKHLVSQPCVYQCTDTNTDSGEIIRIGLDRIDSNKGYTIDNVQPCCARHNLFKSDFLNHEQALDAVYRYRIVCGNTMGGRHRLNSQIPVVG